MNMENAMTKNEANAPVVEIGQSSRFGRPAVVVDGVCEAAFRTMKDAERCAQMIRGGVDIEDACERCGWVSEV